MLEADGAVGTRHTAGGTVPALEHGPDRGSRAMTDRSRRRTVALVLAAGGGLGVAWAVTRTAAEDDLGRATPPVTTNVRAGRDIVTTADATATAWAAAFERGLVDLASELCTAAQQTDRCAPGVVRSQNHEQLDGALERAFAEQRKHVRFFLGQRGELPTFPPRHRSDASAVLQRLAGSDLAPFSTAVGIEVMRLAPSTAPRGLLREIFENPPFGLVWLRVLALDAMAAGSAPEDLAFFRANLIGSEAWISRRAIRALARDPASV
ncbi:MAG: hypothetical protein HY996_00265, partial [Micrococcales bacterium]|nr:hypothetical protein [Micrococcales bacterium]